MRHFFVITFIVAVSLAMLTSCSNEQSTTGVIEIDANINYPKIDLNLDEIAEISYIPLKLGDNNIFIQKPRPRSVFITDDRIFIADGNTYNPRIIVYNHEGDPLYTIGQKGRGPSELFGPICFAVDTIREEVFIWDEMAAQLQVYDMYGKFKRFKSRYVNDRILKFDNIDNININTLVLFLPHAKILSRDKYGTPLNFRSLSFLDKDSMTFHDFPDINFERMHLWATGTMRSSLLTTKSGIYFYTLSSDTTFFINDSLRIMPKFIDVTNYPNPGERGVFPSLETDKYIFFNTYVAGIGQPSLNIDNKNKKFLVFDKTAKKIFSLEDRIEIKRPDNVDYYLFECLDWRNLKYGRTLNPNYVAVFVNYIQLIDYYDKLSDSLKRIADQMSDNDNPVLILMKIK